MWRNTTVSDAFKIVLAIGIFFVAFTCFAANIPAPPPLPDETAVEQDYFQKIYRGMNRFDIVTSAPDGSLKGVKGQPVLYNNSGTWTLWINIDGETDWAQI
jgi:hypothetical protein